MGKSAQRLIATSLPSKISAALNYHFAESAVTSWEMRLPLETTAALAQTSDTRKMPFWAIFNGKSHDIELRYLTYLGIQCTFGSHYTDLNMSLRRRVAVPIHIPP